jgi:CRP/FNR family transcriptional regulator
MNSATNWAFEETGKSTHALPSDALLQLFLRLEDIKLTSSYPRGTVLFAEGQRAAGIYLLRSGRVKVSISSAGGKKVILRIHRAGVLLGVDSVLKDVPCGVTVEAVERCHIDFVPRSDFMKALEKSEAASLGMAHMLSDELSAVVEHLRSLLLSQSAAEKLARLLLSWCDEQSLTRRKEATRVIPGLTHEEIGQMICTSRETVTRVLAEFRRKRMIRLRGKSIFVSDREALESVAGVEKDFSELKKLGCDERHSQPNERRDKIPEPFIMSLDSFI